jgi:hypothetical protein
MPNPAHLCLFSSFTLFITLSRQTRTSDNGVWTQLVAKYSYSKSKGELLTGHNISTSRLHNKFVVHVHVFSLQTTEMTSTLQTSSTATIHVITHAYIEIDTQDHTYAISTNIPRYLQPRSKSFNTN